MVSRGRRQDISETHPGYHYSICTTGYYDVAKAELGTICYATAISCHLDNERQFHETENHRIRWLIHSISGS